MTRQWVICLKYVHGYVRGRPEDKSANWVWTEAGLDPDDERDDVLETYHHEGEAQLTVLSRS